MKKVEVSEIVREIARATHQPESVVSNLYTVVLADMNRDAQIMDVVPLLAAKRVRENLKSCAPMDRLG